MYKICSVEYFLVEGPYFLCQKKVVTKFISPHCDCVKNFVTHFGKPEIWTLRVILDRAQFWVFKGTLVEIMTLHFTRVCI